MLKIQPFYRTQEDLEKADEPYKSVTFIIDKLRLKGPDGKKVLSQNFKETVAVSCIRDLAESLAKSQVTFVSRMATFWNALLSSQHQYMGSFDNYALPYEYYQGVIFGGVFYVLSMQGAVDDEHLEMMTTFVSKNSDALPYFNVFKEAAEKDKQKVGKSAAVANAGDIVEENLHASDGKRIILAKRRNSDFTRIVQAMITDGYFRHADNSFVTATEVGEMMLKLVGVSTEWKSMLQKAYSRDIPLKTFDRLHDAAQKYWLERVHLND